VPHSARPFDVIAPELETVDVVIVGAGAAGLATAIFAARHATTPLRIWCLDGARRVGAKILVSGGSRCNVTNRIVTERDFWGGSSRVVKRVLRGFPADRTAAFFEEIGVALHEEADGKLFPDTNRSRTVLEALLAEAGRLGVVLATTQRVIRVAPLDHGFEIETADGRCLRTRAVVLATGGRSLPKSGSDGGGYVLAQSLGHTLVDTTPALAPMLLAGEAHVPLAGVSHAAALTLRVDGATAIQLEGALLWTHFGISGPVVLNMSRHWLRASAEGRVVELSVNLCPGHSFESVERWWLEHERSRARAQVATVLSTLVPAALAMAVLTASELAPDVTLAHVTKEQRRRVIHRLTALRLEARASRGYDYAEVTAGGVALDEIDPATMGSRRCPGLYLVGEILDVDGRLGGFNFQWAWSSAWTAARAIAREISSDVTRK
jgi:predicted Rossmann fold flavoprotein